MNRLRLHTGDSPLAERGLVRDLAVLGFKLIWEHADVVVSSTLAYYRTTEFYKNMTIIAGGEFSFGPTTQNFMITYGVLRLIFEPVAVAVTGIADEIAREFPDGIGPFVAGFAEVMLGLTAGVVFVSFRILVWSVTMAWWITMVIADGREVPELITTP